LNWVGASVRKLSTLDLNWQAFRRFARNIKNTHECAAIKRETPRARTRGRDVVFRQIMREALNMLHD
jgi:hypothetical protein